jgi:hypothetical protein
LIEPPLIEADGSIQQYYLSETNISLENKVDYERNEDRTAKAAFLPERMEM